MGKQLVILFNYIGMYIPFFEWVIDMVPIALVIIQLFQQITPSFEVKKHSQLYECNKHMLHY